MRFPVARSDPNRHRYLETFACIVVPGTGSRDVGHGFDFGAGRGGPASVVYNQVRTINLALQGGGAHGAFTWGVLDRLLEDKHIAFEGLSATSAGAMNAAVFACGLAVGGREGARKSLADYWQRVSQAARLEPLQPTSIDRMLGGSLAAFSPIFSSVDFVTRLLSPYRVQPYRTITRLRDVVEQSIDFDVLQRPDCPVKLFLSATNVRTGKVKIFAGKEISVDCRAGFGLPSLDVSRGRDRRRGLLGRRIHGKPGDLPADLRLQERRHRHRPYQSAVPRRGAAYRDDILNRINEISFNSSLMREMRAISFVTRLLTQKRVIDGGLKHVLVHSILGRRFHERAHAPASTTRTGTF